MANVDVFLAQKSENPGRGSWALILSQDGQYLFSARKGYSTASTDNSCALGALHHALECTIRAGDWQETKALAKLCEQRHVVIRTELRYVIEGLYTWLPRWTQRNWRGYSNKSVKNRELWQSIALLAQPERVTVKHYSPEDKTWRDRVRYLTDVTYHDLFATHLTPICTQDNVISVEENQAEASEL